MDKEFKANLHDIILQRTEPVLGTVIRLRRTHMYCYVHTQEKNRQLERNGVILAQVQLKHAGSIKGAKK